MWGVFDAYLTFGKLVGIWQLLLFIPSVLIAALWLYLFMHFLFNINIVNLVLAAISYISIVIYSVFILWKLQNRFQKEFEIPSKVSFDSTIRYIRRIKLIDFLEKDYSIKTKVQKEQLLRILEVKTVEYKKDNLVIIGILAALALSVWSQYVGQTMKVGMNYLLTKEYMIILCTAITIIVIITLTVRWYIRVLIINPLVLAQTMCNAGYSFVQI